MLIQDRLETAEEYRKTRDEVQALRLHYEECQKAIPHKMPVQYEAKEEKEGKHRVSTSRYTMAGRAAQPAAAHQARDAFELDGLNSPSCLLL